MRGRHNDRQSVRAWVYSKTSVEPVVRTLATWNRPEDWAERIISLGAPPMRVIAMSPDVVCEVRDAMTVFLAGEDREVLNAVLRNATDIGRHRRL